MTSLKTHSRERTAGQDLGAVPPLGFCLPSCVLRAAANPRGPSRRGSRSRPDADGGESDPRRPRTWPGPRHFPGIYAETGGVCVWSRGRGDRSFGLICAAGISCMKIAPWRYPSSGYGRRRTIRLRGVRGAGSRVIDPRGWCGGWRRAEMRVRRPTPFWNAGTRPGPPERGHVHTQVKEGSCVYSSAHACCATPTCPGTCTHAHRGAPSHAYVCPHITRLIAHTCLHKCIH